MGALDALGALGVSNALIAAIKNTDIEPTASKSNNDTDNEIDISTLRILDAAIKDTDAEPNADGANNNTDAKVDTGVFISKVICNTDVKFTVGKLHKVNTIVKKEVCESNLF